MSTNLILNRILDGRRMTEDDFIQLYEQGDLLAIAGAANTIRDRLYPDNTITYVIDRNINYTNICSCGCRFCAFYRQKGDPDAYVMNEKTLLKKIDEAVELGATQVMIQGGLNEELKLDYYIKMFASIKSRYDITIHSLTAPEIYFIAQNSDLSIKDTLHRLKAAGLDSLPGGGAEILHDAVRSQISPQKINSAQWLEVMHQAHEIGLESTATMMMGSVDNIYHRLEHLRKIRDLQDETGGFRAFISWTYQPGNTKLAGAKFSSLKYLRFLALSRLYLDNIAHIQGSWVTQGKGIGQMTLFFGADDLGSVMIEENVVRATGVAHNMLEEEIISLIAQTGKIPAQRNTRYEILKLYN
ncbi:Menaquinone biosynthesis, SCO4550 [Syntrophomonas zehnderi OL-4]|uniref:Cyclic dehypoxanthine futalosine synthase n=1 Tax=Syntrophomonas zehnderi OL-4 TaxID=690567 RepID=A0A0E4G9U5_9FIRM|nr:cyclic dehypoxanthinyl futalosine synthase [Syntrophomonas zehnderi]CFW96607.1 Menaquinone biosynthesis, SCO4550 [Syntrophomonas zehnderi OL-4]